ncbi:MAG: VWA domain-containing protein [Candidatus Methylarchaceae archaeon HK02M2]|nr:VWA domain-containing protein [Candidatus Methylarchaceae archaeon HK02M2]
MRKKIFIVSIITFFIGTIIFNSVSNLAYAQEVTSELDYTVGLDEIRDSVEPGDIYKVNIVVHGATYESTEVVPFDVMLAIDMSKSMEHNDPGYKRLKAAEEFIQKCRMNSPTPAGSIRAGLIGFRARGRLEHALTDNYDSLYQKINEMYSQDLGEQTNIAGAMAEAHNQLDNHGIYNTRAIILITDGNPEGLGDNEPETQRNLIDNELLPEALIKGFRYYTIALGNNAWQEGLRNIAERTGGFHANTVTADSLINIYSRIFDHVSKIITAGQVKLALQRDTLHTHFIPGSFENPPELADLEDTELDAFENSSIGFIKVNLGPMGGGDVKTISFHLQALECLPVDATQDRIKIYPLVYPDCKVSYLWGTQSITYNLERKFIYCKKTPVITVKKEYIPANSRVEIKITNNYTPRRDIPDSDRTITNIHVHELLSQYFSRNYFGPPNFYDSFISRLDPSFIQPNIFIPGKFGNDFLYWEIRALGPKQSKTLWFRVNSLGWGPRDEDKQLPVDSVDPKDPSAPYTESKVTYKLKNETKTLVIQNKYYTPVMLPDMSAQNGRPNLYIEPPLTRYEFKNLPIPSSDVSSDTRIPSTGPGFLSCSLPERSESADIWIDSKRNQYVNDWTNTASIRLKLKNSNFDFSIDRFKGVTGQGDLFSISSSNRIQFKVHSFGASSNQIKAKVYILEHYGRDRLRLPSQWVLLGDAKIIFSPNWSDYHIFSVEIPENTVREGDHTRLFCVWGNMRYHTATIMIKIAKAQHEGHISNNVSTERFLVVR